MNWQEKNLISERATIITFQAQERAKKDETSHNGSKKTEHLDLGPKSSPEAENDKDFLLRRGEGLFRAGDISSAIAAYSHGIKCHPKVDET